MIKRIRDFLLEHPGMLAEIPIHEITDKHARNLARNIHLENCVTTTIAVTCSDSRNKAIRELLSRIPGVRVYSNAGGIIYGDFYLTTIVFDHGTQCGARSYAEKIKEKGGKAITYPAFVNEVHPKMMENAEKQLNKVSEKYRGGIIYFQQESGEISFKIHDKKGIKFQQSFECERIINELACLKYRYSKEEFAEMASGQNPHIILLTNGHITYNADIFRVDMQNNDASHRIIYDSMNYAVSHALNGESSFKNTDAVIICLDKINHPIPKGFPSFFKKILPTLRSFVERGGEVLLVSVGSREGEKRVYRVK